MTTGGQQQLKTLTNAITKASPRCRLGPPSSPQTPRSPIQRCDTVVSVTSANEISNPSLARLLAANSVAC